MGGGGFGAWVQAHMNFIFRILRTLFPIISVSWKGKRYAAVFRFDDVQEVLSRPEVFTQPYGPKLANIMAGGDFMLGENDPAAHAVDRATMRVVMPPADVAGRLAPETGRLATEVVDAATPDGRLDLVWDFSQVVTTRLFGPYLGAPGPDLTIVSNWAQQLFDYCFADLGNDPATADMAWQNAAALRAYLDKTIIDRKAARARGEACPDDVLQRCLILQDAATPGVTDTWIRNNLFGMLVGGLPQAPILVPQLMDVLLDRPEKLAGACAAARDGDMERLSAYVFEAARFKPLAPALIRGTAQDYRVAGGTWRSKTIPAGTTLFAVLQSAMFDGRRVPDPEAFRLNRPDYSYMLFGYGIHTCFGIYINRAMIPALCAPLLRQRNLRRAEGDDGRLQMNGIFPTRLVVTFDP